MNADTASTLIIDLGRLTGHKHGELEIVKRARPFFGNFSATTYLRMQLSNGSIGRFRLIFRGNNSMWRIELNDDVPEIAAGVFPIVSGIVQNRSNYGAIIHRVSGGVNPLYELTLLPTNHPTYVAALATAGTSGIKRRSYPGPSGRDFGWY